MAVELGGREEGGKRGGGEERKHVKGDGVEVRTRREAPGDVGRRSGGERDEIQNGKNVCVEAE